MLITPFLILSAVFTLVIQYAKRHLREKRRRLKTLPGPRGYPLIGSVPDLPEKNLYIKLFEWSKKYGPIYQTNLAGKIHVWITSDETARELLSKKGAIYSDRPHIAALIADNRTSAQYLPLLSKNDAWARQRKFANQIMKETENAEFYNYPEIESRRLLMELMEDSGRYHTALESFVSRVTCRLAWGRSEASDELKQRARELLYTVSPTGHIGNKLPFLMNIPDWLSPGKPWERRRAKTEEQFFATMQSQVERDMAAKLEKNSWMKTYLSNGPDAWKFAYNLEGAYCVGMHAIAGALTIAAPMQTFLLAMCHYPQHHHMLQQEIDKVCGDRLPTRADSPNLPFLRAVIRECLRWRPPVPTGIPHELTQDDTYDDYHLPAGAIIHPLEWGIARDPELFPDPEKFNPLRWLDPKFPTYREPLTQYPTIINISQFGYGRRVCQGQGVAYADLIVAIGAIAWLFEVSKPAKITSTSRTKGTTDLDPTLDFSTLLIAKPLPFDVTLTVRNEDRAETVKREFSDLKAKGEFKASAEYWGVNQGQGQPLGWSAI